MAKMSEVNFRELPRWKTLDDIADAAEWYGYLKPIDYAKIRSIAPQLVYHKIRNRKIKVYMCDCCGNGPLIAVKEADEAFAFKQGVLGQATTEEE